MNNAIILVQSAVIKSASNNQITQTTTSQD